MISASLSPIEKNLYNLNHLIIDAFRIEKYPTHFSLQESLDIIKKYGIDSFLDKVNRKAKVFQTDKEYVFIYKENDIKEENERGNLLNVYHVSPIIHQKYAAYSTIKLQEKCGKGKCELLAIMKQIKEVSDKYENGGFIEYYWFDVVSQETVVKKSSKDYKIIKDLDELNKFVQSIKPKTILSFDIETDGIWHLACPASPIHYQFNPIKTAKTSFIGTYNMLGMAKRVGAKFLLASTSEIYGDPEVHPQPETYRGNVNPIGIRSCYDEGKRIAESLCFDYFRKLYTIRILIFISSLLLFLLITNVILSGPSFSSPYKRGAKTGDGQYFHRRQPLGTADRSHA